VFFFFPPQGLVAESTPAVSLPSLYGGQFEVVPFGRVGQTTGPSPCRLLARPSWAERNVSLHGDVENAPYHQRSFLFLNPAARCAASFRRNGRSPLFSSSSTDPSFGAKMPPARELLPLARTFGAVFLASNLTIVPSEFSFLYEELAKSFLAVAECLLLR